MAYTTFDELNAEIQRLYGAGQYGELYDLLTAEGGQFPDESMHINYLRSCMAARVDRSDLALQVIGEAFDAGNWYGEHLMRDSPSYVALQGLSGFEALVERGKAEQAAAWGKVEVLVEEPAAGCQDSAPCPLIVALHGNGENARRAMAAWRPLTERGWLIAAVQSGQPVMGGNSYVWNDAAQALQEVGTEYEHLSSQYNVDAVRVVSAGFSMGGETALRMALAQTIPASGFVLLGPGGLMMRSPESWRPLIAAAANTMLRGYVLVGEAEPEEDQQNIRATVAMLDEAGIACEFKVVPVIGHAYPANFADYVGRALEFIYGEAVAG